jgi:hypothetical protein
VLDFRNRNGLPLTTELDDRLLEALKTAQPIRLPVEQTTATTEKVTEKVEAVRQTWYARAYARVAQWVSGVVTVVWAVVSLITPVLPQATEILRPVRDFLGEIPGWVWGGAVFVVAYIVARNSGRALVEQIAGYQEGRVKNDPPPPTVVGGL